jgi:hypothetical protein
MEKCQEKAKQNTSNKNSNSANKNTDNVVDAEFEEVKDSKK